MVRLVDIVNYSEAYSDVFKIQTLPYGWDGNIAFAGKDYPINEALAFLNLLRDKRIPAPWVFATKRHSVQFEWNIVGKDYLEVEVYYHYLSLLRVTNPLNYTYHTDKQDYKHQDIILEQVKRWNLGLPFLVKVV